MYDNPNIQRAIDETAGANQLQVAADGDLVAGAGEAEVGGLHVDLGVGI